MPKIILQQLMNYKQVQSGLSCTLTYYCFSNNIKILARGRMNRGKNYLWKNHAETGEKSQF